MKSLLVFLTLGVGFLFFPAAGHSQGCYMVDDNGEEIDLSSLCENNNSSPTVTSTPGVFESPIKRRQNGIPVIEVSFNNQETVEMMVDTGASATVLPPEVATRLGIEPEGKVRANTPSDKEVEFPAGRVESINAGGAIAQDVVVIIAPALSMGLLGQNFFSRYDVSIREDVVQFRDR
ncbi:MAG: TIGR02281 family clan AA aspartic protease [Halothece sp.]